MNEQIKNQTEEIENPHGFAPSDMEHTIVADPESYDISGDDETDSLEYFDGILKPGESFGGYEIIDKIASGGSAVIYRAEHIGLQRTVALKVMTSTFASNPDFVEMFVREARATAKLKHPNIIQTFDAGTCDGIPYLAMELIDGGNLMELIRNREEEVDIIYLLEIMSSIADALHYGQEKLHLTHGDIKPENVLIDFEGNAHLADFGLAETIAHRRKNANGKKVFITPLYAAPETLSRTAIPGEPHPDIYSFGCMMFHILTGHPPFQDNKLRELVYSHMHREAPELKTLIPDINYNLNILLAEMLSKNPAKRPADWKEIHTRLETIIEELKRPVRYTAKRHIQLAFAFSNKELWAVIALYAAIIINLNTTLGIILVSMTILINYLVKSAHEPQSWIGVFKNHEDQ